MRIQPFAALRPREGMAPRVASLPYDVMSADEAREMAAGNPDSFLHVVRSEIDLPADLSPYDDRVYATARDNFRRLIRESILVQDPAPGLYLYRQVRNHRAQIGLVCCCNVEEYAGNVIRRHEKTRREKEDDRTRHVLAINANAGPVFLTYRDDEGVDALVADDVNDRPLFHFNAPDGITHTGWAVKDPQAYIERFASIPVVYVADGHHRAASAARAAAERAAANARHRGDEEYNWFLCALLPASQLTILPYHRVVRDLGGRGTGDVRAALERVGRLEPAVDPQPDRRGTFGIYIEGRWWSLALDPASIPDDPVEGLDVELLQQRVLEPILGIGDPRSDARIDFVGGIRGTGELQRLVDRGAAAIAFALHPTSIEQLLEVADANMIMPPKSTWFEPKLRSGLFVHELG